MRSIIKTRQDNNVTNRKGVISMKYDIELLRLIRRCAVYDEDEKWQLMWPIVQCVVYDEDEIGQWRDESYKFALLLKQN